MTGPDPDTALRLAALQWLAQAVAVHGDVLPRPLLEAGFEYAGRPIHLVGPQGIWKPGPMDLPLTITTVAGGPYAEARDFTAGAGAGRGAQRGRSLAARPPPRLGDPGPAEWDADG